MYLILDLQSIVYGSMRLCTHTLMGRCVAATAAAKAAPTSSRTCCCPCFPQRFAPLPLTFGHCGDFQVLYQGCPHKSNGKPPRILMLPIQRSSELLASTTIIGNSMRLYFMTACSCVCDTLLQPCVCVCEWSPLLDLVRTVD